MLVGNRVDIAKQEVSLLRGKEMARILGCGFVETLAKDGENVQEAVYSIVIQLQTLCMKQALLDDFIDS